MEKDKGRPRFFFVGKKSPKQNPHPRPRPSAMMVIWMPGAEVRCFFIKEGNLENALSCFFVFFFRKRVGKTIVGLSEEVAINAIWEIIYEILELCTQWIFSWSLDECRNGVRLWRCRSSLDCYRKNFSHTGHKIQMKFNWIWWDDS